MQTIDLEMTKELSDALFNPRESSILREPSREGLLDYGPGCARAGFGATGGGRKKTEPKASHGDWRLGRYGQIETSDVATRPAGNREKRRSPGILSWSSSVSEPKSLADQIANHQGALTAAELGRHLGIARVSVFKMAKRGVIPCFRLGTSVRFCPATIARWLRERGG